MHGHEVLISRKKLPEASAASLLQPIHHHWQMRQILTAILVCAACMAAATPAYASAMYTVLCLVFDIIEGNLGRSLAVLAVMIVGVGSMLGKTSPGLALTVVIGISILFAAQWIVNTLLRIQVTCS
jgi:type IV secretory pathway VirB2 component (pilin)